jgi:hypothetical protein
MIHFKYHRPPPPLGVIISNRHQKRHKLNGQERVHYNFIFLVTMCQRKRKGVWGGGVVGSVVGGGGSRVGFVRLSFFLSFFFPLLAHEVS